MKVFKRFINLFLIGIMLFVLIGCGNNKVSKNNKDSKNTNSTESITKDNTDNNTDNSIDDNTDNNTDNNTEEKVNSTEEPAENEKSDSEDKQNLNSKDGQAKTEVSVSKPTVSKALNIIKVGTNDITFRWAKVQQATSYNIYRSLSKNGKYTKIATSKGTSYTDKKLIPSTAYCYKISAVNSAGEGKLSNVISSVTKEEVKNKIGNTSANINNAGYAAVQGEWVYASYAPDNPAYADKAELYKIKLDGTEKTKLLDYGVNNINVVGEWIYFRDLYNGHKLCKVKIDGTNKTIISNDMPSFINVIGEWIYYSNDSDGGKLYKIKIDGTNRIKLNDDLSQYLTIDGECIYYINENEHKIYKIKTDGTEREKILDEVVYSMQKSGDYIFFTRLLGDKYPKHENMWLYRVKTDGTDITKLEDRSVQKLNIVGDWIYYYAKDYSTPAYVGGIYKMKIDGSNKTVIKEHVSHANISVIGNWIYYENWRAEPQGTLYKIKTDGTENQKVQ